MELLAIPTQTLVILQLVFILCCLSVTDAIQVVKFKLKSVGLFHVLFLPRRPNSGIKCLQKI